MPIVRGSRLTTSTERRGLDEARILLEDLGYPTAANAVNEALRFDSQQREAAITDDDSEEFDADE